MKTDKLQCFKPIITPFGEAGFLATFEHTPLNTDPAHRVAVALRMYQLMDKLQDDGKGHWFDITPGLSSIAARFDPLRLDPHTAQESFAESVGAKTQSVISLSVPAPVQSLSLPVCFEAEFAPDLLAICVQTGLTQKEIISTLISAPLRIINMGFAPGFAYMGPLDQRLIIPRLDAPRTHVPAGALGLAAGMAGLYSLGSPGGWSIVGRTPIPLFDVAKSDPFLLRPNTEIILDPISSDAFERKLS